MIFWNQSNFEKANWFSKKRLKRISFSWFFLFAQDNKHKNEMLKYNFLFWFNTVLKILNALNKYFVLPFTTKMISTIFKTHLFIILNIYTWKGKRWCVSKWLMFWKILKYLTTIRNKWLMRRKGIESNS